MVTPTDWTPYILLGLTTFVVPSGSWLITQTIKNKSSLDKHEATDRVQLKNIDARLDALQQGQDRLIAHLITRHQPR